MLFSFIFLTETAKNDDNDNCCSPSTQSDILSKPMPQEAPNKTPQNDSPDALNNKDENAANAAKEDSREKIDFKVIYNKKKIDISFALDGTVGELKDHLQNIISVPQAMQKIMIKGLAKDDQTLRSLGVTKGLYINIFWRINFEANIT